jgi:hypothetical protein
MSTKLNRSLSQVISPLISPLSLGAFSGYELDMGTHTFLSYEVKGSVWDNIRAPMTGKVLALVAPVLEAHRVSSKDSSWIECFVKVAKPVS